MYLFWLSVLGKNDFIKKVLTYNFSIQIPITHIFHDADSFHQKMYILQEINNIKLYYCCCKHCMKEDSCKKRPHASKAKLAQTNVLHFLSIFKEIGF